nr:MAG TPA: PolyVal Metallopeptidase superfamily domain [Caudoviricetes sp.]
MYPQRSAAFRRPSFEALQREAARLGATIKLVRGFRLLGAWEADTGTIYIREGLSSPERECVLAHELEHAIRGDVGPQPPETEAHIDIEVARRFVDPWEYTCAEKAGGGVAQIAIAMDLPTWVVQAWAKKVTLDRSVAPRA